VDGPAGPGYNRAGKFEGTEIDGKCYVAPEGLAGAGVDPPGWTGAMLGRVLALFDHYAREHVALACDGFPLIGEAGQAVGAVERIRLAGNRIVVEGWTCAPRVTLVTGGSRHATAPNLRRADVAAAGTEGPVATPGFRLDAPFQPGPLTIGVDLGGRSYGREIDPFPDRLRARAARRLWPRYVLALARGVPAYLRWSLTRDPAARARIKRLMGLGRIPRVQAMDARLLDPPVAGAPSPTCAISIVMPVFNAMEVLPDALDRLARHTDLRWHLILVEDRSTDPAVRPFLRDWAVRQPPGAVDLIETAENLGFIGAANRGLARAVARGDHVILVNSDVLVPPGWASRLIRPILQAPESVASVTPTANDAEILSVPVIALRSDLRPGEADRIDALAAGFAPDAALAEVPTGIGFCMAMNIRYLGALPAFDTGFGRGYGEEVDWCQKVRAAGGRHMAMAGLFVEHRGGLSFGSVEKRKLVARNNAAISARYPGYDAEVQAFIRNDPMATARLALAIGWAAARGGERPTPLYLAHALGGGAEDYLAARIARDLDPGSAGLPAALVLRVGTEHRWRLELHSLAGVTQGATDDFALIAALLRPLPRLAVVYSCGVDDPDAIAIPDLLLSLLRGPGDRAEALMHDYYPISPSYTLLDADGFHRGLPPPDTADRAHRVRRPDGTVASLGDWQAAWGRFLSACDRIVTFSENSRALTARAYPAVAGRIVVEPHAMLANLPPCSPPPPGRRPVIGVLGNIGRQKGAALLGSLSRRLAQSGAADLVLIGNIDPNFPLAPQTTVHGTYARRDIPALVARYGIGCWLIPSIWPETFSYTTHECIATGLPVWSFDLGAQGDAVRAAAARTGRGGVLPLVEGRPSVDLVIARLVPGAAAPVRAGRPARRRETA
jgi:GT2 family glycosyltransferase